MTAQEQENNTNRGHVTSLSTVDVTTPLVLYNITILHVSFKQYISAGNSRIKCQHLILSKVEVVEAEEISAP